MKSRVFVALKGEDLTIECRVTKPANQSEDMLECFDPTDKLIISRSIASTAGKPLSQDLAPRLQHLSVSGEYYCKYRTAAVYWYVRVRDEGFKMPHVQDSTEYTVVGAVTAALLLFSVVGSVYVFRGHWITKCRQTDKNEKENKEVMKKRRGMTENTAALPDSSASFYASLEPRTRSIYDELRPSAASNSAGQQRAKPKKREPHQTNQQSRQEEGQFDSVYENY
ncbi:uncharacterized protein si:ch211-243a20.4 isoform X2 [Betta splendens]|nr:uncharacterized protein si:ch211-243a20.4 isoform X2 [Betta splendens]